MKLNRRQASALGLLPAFTQAAPVLRLALLEYPGFYERTPGGGGRGLDLDIAEALQMRSGLSLQIEATSAARAWRALQAHQVDLSSGLAYLPERKLEVEYLWVLRGHAALYMPSALAQRLQRLEDFEADPALTLGVLRSARRGAQAQSLMDRMQARGRLVEAVDMHYLLRGYEAGRMSSVLLLPGALQGQSSDWQESHVAKDWLPNDEMLGGWAMQKRLPEGLRERLRQAGQALRKEGELTRALVRHLGAAAAQQYRYLAEPTDSPSPGSGPTPN